MNFLGLPSPVISHTPTNRVTSLLFGVNREAFDVENWIAHDVGIVVDDKVLHSTC